jgi:outer membrane protein
VDRVGYYRSFVFPRVSLFGAYTLNQDEVAFGSGADRTLIQPQDDWSATVGFRQPIYAGGREWRAYRQSKLEVEQADARLSDSENLVLIQVGSDYLTAVESQALAEVERKNVELAGRRLDQAQAFFEVGEVTQVDVLRAEASIKAAERLLASAEGERDKAEGRLRVALDIEGDLEVVPPGDFLPPMPDEAALFAQAAAAFPVLRDLELEVEIAALEVKKQKGAALPVLFADGGWTQQKREFPSSDNASISLNLSVPLFTAGEIKSEVAEAKSKERLARLELGEAQRTLREAIHAALLDLATARKVRELAEEELETARLEHAQAFELYRAQEATALDLEVAELSLASALRTAVTADIDAKVAELEAWYLSGALKPAFAPQPAPASQEGPREGTTEGSAP